MIPTRDQLNIVVPLPIRIKNAELTPYERGQIAGAAAFGGSKAAISRATGFYKSIIRKTLKLDTERVQGQSKPRLGRPKLSDKDIEAAILDYVRKHPKHTYQQVKCGTDTKHLSRTTIRRILRENGILNWRAKRRPHLTEAVAAMRLAQCLERAHWRKKEWETYMWSDECSVERGKGKAWEWVFCTL